jgi:hypothetical protein
MFVLQTPALWLAVGVLVSTYLLQYFVQVESSPDGVVGNPLVRGQGDAHACLALRHLPEKPLPPLPLHVRDTCTE